MASGLITSWQIDGETMEAVRTFLFFWAPKSLQMVTVGMKLKHACSLGEKSYDQPKEHIKKQRHYFANKCSSSQGYGFSSSHVWMWELDYRKRWAPKNWCFWTVVFEKTLESPLDCKEIQSVYPKDQSRVFIWWTDAEAETPILWPPCAKSWLIGKDLDAGKDWRQERKGMTKNEMVGWHHQLDGHESEQVLGVGDAQGSLVGCSPWGHKESDTTEWLNWNDCDQCELISHCSFDLHFSNNMCCWASFCVLFGSLYAIVREMSIQIICSFSDWVVFCVFLIFFYMSYLYVLKINLLSIDLLINVFSHSVGFLFIFYGSLISPFKFISFFFQCGSSNTSLFSYFYYQAIK